MLKKTVFAFFFFWLIYILIPVKLLADQLPVEMGKLVYEQLGQFVIDKPINLSHIFDTSGSYITDDLPENSQSELMQAEGDPDALNPDRTTIHGFLIFGLLVIMLWNGILYKQYRRKQQANEFLRVRNETIKTQTEELRNKNRNLLSSESSLQESNRTKDKFFSIISHDLKGPLNSLTGLLQILIKYVDSFSKEELKEFAANMDRSVRNSLELLDHLLQWSRTQTGNIEYRPQKLHLTEVVENTANLLNVAAQNKQITLQVSVDEEVFVFADSNMLSFVLRNLIVNAIKFTQRGGTVQVYAKSDGKMVELSVIDNGVGISANNLKKLFKIDSYHSTNGTANEMGTGLGLILCNEFIEKNGGYITVESELNKGSAFRFTVPRAVPVNVLA